MLVSLGMLISAVIFTLIGIWQTLPSWLIALTNFIIFLAGSVVMFRRQEKEKRKQLLFRIKNILDEFHELTLHSGLVYSIIGIANGFFNHLKRTNEYPEKAKMWDYYFNETHTLLIGYAGALRRELDKEELLDSIERWSELVERFKDLLFGYYRVMESFRKVAKENSKVLPKQVYQSYDKFSQERDELVRKLRNLAQDLNKTIKTQIDIKNLDIFQHTPKLFAS